MPIYEYVCKKCDHAFELLVSGSARPACPECNSKKLDKQHSVFSPSIKENSAPAKNLPPECGSCTHPDGPGACSMN
ncbi:MAG: zinc ribbon domain-containing protein, partial [Nitrospinaceae bacterium]|nr:zinc ribbon domain-containing protein [Nitrospinaceae bacterium]